MARFEVNAADQAVLGATSACSDVFFRLGMMYATGRSVPTDLVTAHKWFNIAASKGNRDAVRYRGEISADMSKSDIASALRAAREWLTAS